MSSQERQRLLAQGIVDGVHSPVGGARPAGSTTAFIEVAATMRRGPPAPAVRTIFVGEREHRLYLLKAEQIDYIESHGNYVKFHCAGAEYISRDSVKHLATVLTNGFLRIERSLLINVQAIMYAERAGRGTYTFTLFSGAVLHSGARYRDMILRLLPLGQRSQLR